MDSRQRTWLRIIILGVVAAVVLVHPTTSAKEPLAPAGTPTGAPPSSVSKAAEQRLSAKLDQILANQQKILARLDEVMQELNIVKIRATPRQPR